MPQADSTHIDTAAFGLALAFWSPKSAKNRHRSKWLIIFDTGVEMLVPLPIFETMRMHLREADHG